MHRRLCLTALLAISAGTHLLLLGGKSLWADEAYTAGLLDRSFPEAASLFSRGTPHPCGGFFLTWSSASLFGRSEFGMRALVSLLTASSVIPVFLFLRRHLSRGAFWGALCWAASPWAVSLGQEAWVYGPLAALTAWAIHLADLSWRGSKAALAAFLPIAVAGFLVQHIFVFTAAAALGLYLTIPRGKRASPAAPLLASAVMLASFLAVFLPFTGQFEARAERMAAAGVAGIDFGRVLSGAAGVFSRLWVGGLIPESLRGALASRVSTAVLLAAVALQTPAVLHVLLSRRTLDRGIRIWLGAVLLIPFLIFLRDFPTPRQFPLAALALAFSAAALASRMRLYGPLSAAFCIALLVPYYNLRSFPYHRSDWRGAVALVESRAGSDDLVMLLGAKTALQAWDFYSRSSLDRIAPECRDPYLGDREASPRLDPAPIADSAAAEGRTVWFVQDYWGGAPVEAWLGDLRIRSDTTLGTVRVVQAVSDETTP
ncbi:glycosyltransferase family 39 protein [Candidatus Fermentibacteria bacterium]|nr:glycosyltransferase family 39 protein [Candidatus Fermentibacteria bacterium]